MEKIKILAYSIMEYRWCKKELPFNKNLLLQEALLFPFRSFKVHIEIYCNEYETKEYIIVFKNNKNNYSIAYDCKKRTRRYINHKTDIFNNIEVNADNWISEGNLVKYLINYFKNGDKHKCKICNDKIEKLEYHNHAYSEKYCERCIDFGYISKCWAKDFDYIEKEMIMINKIKNLVIKI